MFTESITRLRQSLSLFLFNLIYRLLFSRWVRDYSEHHDACEDAYSGRSVPSNWTSTSASCWTTGMRL
jgi:hypothetical protein